MLPASDPGPLEGPAQALALLRRDGPPLILDPDLDRGAVLPGTDPDRSAGGATDHGIGKQAADELGYPVGVAAGPS